MNFWIFAVKIFLIIGPKNIFAWECEYHSNGIEISDQTRLSTYGCDVKDLSSNPNTITGSHSSGENDKNVKFIYKYWGKGAKFKFTSTFCQKFTNLEDIFLRREIIQSIDGNALKNCKNLKGFQLFGNELKNIPQKLLEENTKLTVFVVESNKLQTLPDNIFTNQRDLEKLSLYNNEITVLSSNIFKSQIKLKILNLGQNKLTSVNPNWFLNLRVLETLNLDKNEISNIPENSFISLHNLRELHLSDNKIGLITTNLFRNLRNLEILDMEENEITAVRRTDFQNNNNLKGLSLNNNKISSMARDSFSNLRKLETLGLGSNEISNLPKNIFSSLQSLKDLGLNGNKLTAIHSDSFGTNPTLTNVFFGNNKISHIDSKFIEYTGVSKLEMNNNLCYDGWIYKKEQMRESLKGCFTDYQARVDEPDEDQQVSNNNKDNSCGVAKFGIGNIVGGSKIVRGSYPWIAALVYNDGSYFCGGTLVSDQKVVTAAHCIQEKYSRIRLFPGDLKVLLGSHDLNVRFDTETQSVAVLKIHVHHEWNIQIESYNADIAVLVLAKKINFNSYIQPICLIEPFSNIEAIKNGTVVGYGKSEDTSKVHENIPKMIELPIHENEDCFLREIALTKLSSKKTFCAGSGLGEGVCLGDSGGGLVVSHGGAYYLRGIVSSSIRGSQHGCDLNTYSVFTNVLKFNDWINDIDPEEDFYATRFGTDEPVWT